jgi:hypothetical protein
MKEVDKMLVFIEEDELYPHFTMTQKGRAQSAYDIPESVVNRYEAAYNEFKAARVALRQAMASCVMERNK